MQQFLLIDGIRPNIDPVDTCWLLYCNTVIPPDQSFWSLFDQILNPHGPLFSASITIKFFERLTWIYTAFTALTVSTVPPAAILPLLAQWANSSQCLSWACCRETGRFPDLAESTPSFNFIMILSPVHIPRLLYLSFLMYAHQL